MAITALPTPPTRDDAASFRSRADSFLAALPTFATECNATAAAVSASESAAASSASAAGLSQSAAAASAAQASNSAAAAQSYAGAAAWVSGTSYAVGQVVWSPVSYLLYRRVIAGAGATDPSADATNWALASSGAPQLIETAAASIIAQANGHYVLTGSSAQEVVLPASPPPGALIWVTVANDRVDNVVRRNGALINKQAEDLVLDDELASVAIRSINSTLGWRTLAS